MFYFSGKEIIGGAIAPLAPMVPTPMIFIYIYLHNYMSYNYMCDHPWERWVG